MQLSGAFTNGGTAGGDGTYQLAGDWTNNGSYTTSLGTVTFNGTGVQNLHGSAATQTFYSVAIDNTSGVTLGGSTNFNINGLLTIINTREV